MKRCAHCGPVRGLLPDSEFHAHAHHADGLASVCKTCRSAYRKKYRAVNKDLLALADAGYREMIRDKVFGHYGMSCVCCGTSENLTIDHVHGNGAAHRAELGQDGSGYQFYLWLVREGFPDGFQSMCKPCNSSKWTGERCRMHQPE
jgi:hypothetical protein